MKKSAEGTLQINDVISFPFFDQNDEFDESTACSIRLTTRI